MDYRILVLILSIAMTLFTLAMKILSYRSIGKKIPDCLSDIYDEETYKKYQSYQKACDKFDIVKTLVINFGVTLALFLTPLFPLICQNIENKYLAALLVILAYVGITTLVGIPFDYVFTFKIEEKYGFNKTKGKTFLGDEIKGFLLGMLLMYGLVALYMCFYDLMKLYSILLIAVVLLAFILLLNLLMPVLVQINFKKTPLEEGELRSELTSLLQSEGYEVKDIYVVDGSKRSSKANAFFTGVGKLKSIMLYDTLVSIMTPREIAAVFAHEMGHGKHKDTAKNVVLSFVSLTLMVSLLVLFTYLQETTSFLNNVDPAHSAFLFLLYIELFVPFYNVVFGILSNFSSRKAEYLADKMAKDKGYQAELISALKKLGLNNYSNLTPSKVIVFLSYSHPTLEERINALSK